MNILLFTAIYPTNNDSRIPPDTKAIHYFTKQWVDLGHNVEVIYLYQNPLKRINLKNLRNIFKPKISDYWYEGIHVNLFETQLLIPHTNKCLKLQIKSFEKYFNRVLSSKKEKFNPELISMHFPMSFYGCDILKNFKCKSIAVLHNCDLNTANKIKKDKVLSHLKNFKKIGSRNKKIKSNLLEQYNISSEIIYSGIPEEIFISKTNINNKYFLKNGICNIIFVGNLIPLKKVENILYSMINFKYDYKITIVGDGPEKKQLIEICKKLKIEEKVLFTGKLSREQSIEMMREADVFVMTSKPETFGLVYLEAMAQGCITIGSKNEGIDGVIINNYNGYLVTPGDTEELSELLNNIYELPEEKKREISINAYKTACEMTNNKMARKYLDLI